MDGIIFVANSEKDVVDYYLRNISFEQFDKYILVSENDYQYYETRVFDFINVECDVLIDKYEEETLCNDKINKAISVIHLLKNNSEDIKVTNFLNELLDLLSFALNTGKNVEFQF